MISRECSSSMVHECCPLCASPNPMQPMQMRETFRSEFPSFVYFISVHLRISARISRLHCSHFKPAASKCKMPLFYPQLFPQGIFALPHREELAAMTGTWPGTGGAPVGVQCTEDVSNGNRIVSGAVRRKVSGHLCPPFHLVNKHQERERTFSPICIITLCNLLRWTGLRRTLPPSS